eukprot:GFYU01022937.1.p1 GENE.GFYU01022937.1~~GFYU01022937.1.p1  ORF type:complete len:331 (+),score=49.06 GFYU01022937.1:125-1117(+)
MDSTPQPNHSLHCESHGESNHESISQTRDIDAENAYFIDDENSNSKNQDTDHWQQLQSGVAITPLPHTPRYDEQITLTGFSTARTVGEDSVAIDGVDKDAGEEGCNSDSSWTHTAFVKESLVAADIVRSQVAALEADRRANDAIRDRQRRDKLVELEALGRWPVMGKAEFALKRFYRKYVRSPYYQNHYATRIGFFVNLLVIAPTLAVVLLLYAADNNDVSLTDRAYASLHTATLGLKGFAFVDMWLKVLFLGHISPTAKFCAFLTPKVYGKGGYFPQPSMVWRVSFALYGGIVTTSYACGASGVVSRPVDIALLCLAVNTQFVTLGLNT